MHVSLTSLNGLMVLNLRKTRLCDIGAFMGFKLIKNEEKFVLFSEHWCRSNSLT